MRPILVWFGERPLVDCAVKENSIFAAGQGFLLECNRELDPHFAAFYTSSRNGNVMVRTRPA
jgi:hypothetical protein